MLAVCTFFGNRLSTVEKHHTVVYLDIRIIGY